MQTGSRTTRILVSKLVCHLSVAFHPPSSLLGPLMGLFLLLSFGPWAFNRLTNFVKNQKPIGVHYHRLAGEEESAVELPDAPDASRCRRASRCPSFLPPRFLHPNIPWPKMEVLGLLSQLDLDPLRFSQLADQFR